MLKIGHKVPDFSCEAVINGEIKKIALADFANKYKLLFFYPLNFTFVCPTELHALQDSLTEFEKRDTQILGVSVDSAHSHFAWLNTPRKTGGIEGISFPLLSDLKKELAHSYGVLNEEQGIALRGVFLLDKHNVLQYAAVNNLGLGRSITELLRLVDALAHVEKYGEVCPANWQPGKAAMKANQAGLKEYFDK
jgi:peroxiredoxin 2/4